MVDANNNTQTRHTHRRIGGDLTWDADTFVEKVVRSHFVGPWQRLLDMQAGRGELAVRSARVGYLVDGIDRDEATTTRAKRWSAMQSVADRCRFSTMPSAAMSFADGTFDIVVAQGLADSSQLRQTAGEINRVLKPGGMALLKVSLRHATPTPGNEHPLHAAPRALSAQDVYDMERTFEGVHVERFTILGRIDRILPDVDASLRSKLKHLDYRLLRACPSFAARSTTSVLICRKREQAMPYRAAA